MKNRDYWRRRFEILEAAAADKGQDCLRALDREYKTAMRGVEAEISKWYRRFAANNGITLAEARKLLNGGELAEFRWSVEDYIKYGQENALNHQWAKQLENASARVHISRLEALQLEIQQQIEVLYGNRLDGIDGLARKIYSDGYYHTAFEVQKGFSIGWDLAPLNQKQLDSVVSRPWTLDRQTFSDRIWKQKGALVAAVQTTLTQAILRGDSPDRAIKAISKQFNVSRNQAGRLVMTESAYFASVAQKDCFNALDVERFEIVATLDSHTSELCQGLDGHIEEMKNYEAGVTAPPFHPWCRTTTIPFFEDNYGERAARGADGKTYYVPSDMKYAEWKEKYVKPAQETALKNSPIRRIIGITAANGATVKNVAEHFADSMAKRGFAAENVIEALTNPLHVTEPITDAHGRQSIQFVGHDATVVYNPVGDVIVTGWRTGKDRRKKYGGAQ
jgi:SPP1 gp7 family putative phage head morphogenesis protein